MSKTGARMVSGDGGVHSQERGGKPKVLTPDFRVSFSFLALGFYLFKVARCSVAGVIFTSLGVFLVLQTSRLRFRFAQDGYTSAPT